ncbi:MGMT family protein [Moheibacter stercoris]|uniref:Methylated-DNA-protein-cysteine methyltransferase-like protein n=1 Tax=Moheibacter stercoris TaxID=1628251 RepID=A0ABV2LWG6_9FLAO
MTKNESLYEKVYDVVRKIPEGKVTSYGAIATFLGRKGSARMIGYAMNNSHAFDDIPAHRVVNRKGLLTGKHHFSPPSLMQQLLENEGIEIEDDQIQNFSNVFWDPMKELIDF